MSSLDDGVNGVKSPDESINGLDESMKVVELLQNVIFNLHRNMFKGLEDKGITPPQGMIIGNLSKIENMKVSDLSTKLGLSNSTVSGMIDRLEKMEIVTRTRSKEDKRVVYVSLCNKFKDMHKNLHQQIDENFKGMMSKATPEDIRKVNEGFSILKRLLGDD